MENLRYYLATCALPEMENGRKAPDAPPDGHKSHKNHLHINPEPWRRLENIYPLKVAVDEAIKLCTIAKLFLFVRAIECERWIDEHALYASLDFEDDIDAPEEQLTVPCPLMVDFSPGMMKRPDTIMRMAPWIDNLPLQTAQCALHSLFPQTRDYGFSLAEDPENVDKDLFQYFTWSAGDKGITDLHPTSRITVAFQPPWILSDKDIKLFSKCKSFPPFRKTGDAYPTRLENSQQKLWGKIWDTCVRRRSRWFVLTSYNNWVFGAFSEGWSTAFVTDVYPYDSYNPSIVECLVFWIASAMRISGTASIPKVGDETAYLSSEIPCTVYDVMGRNPGDTPARQVYLL
ncbi:hypothetical protein FPV67DRAFT_1404301 [Lyophyllum atratum]|nr:hypothetical protein FPV67DRAFT_1404301 [Lyophyllum atratum]